MRHRHRYTDPDTNLIGLPDDLDTLMELLADSESLFTQSATNYRKRLSERRIILDKLGDMRRNLDEVMVSEHAVVRYLERVKGMDIKSIRREIIGLVPQKKDARTYKVEFNDDYHFVIADNLIVTIRPNAPRDNTEPQRTRSNNGDAVPNVPNGGKE